MPAAVGHQRWAAGLPIPQLQSHPVVWNSNLDTLVDVVRANRHRPLSPATAEAVPQPLPVHTDAVRAAPA